MELPVPSNLLREDLARARAHSPASSAPARSGCWTTQRYDGSPLAARVEQIWDHKERLFAYRLAHASPCAAWYARDAVTDVRRPRRGGRGAARVVRPGRRGDRDRDSSARRPRATAAPTPRVADGRCARNGPNEIDVEVPAAARARDGWLVLRVSHDPGWAAATAQRRAAADRAGAGALPRASRCQPAPSASRCATRRRISRATLRGRGRRRGVAAARAALDAKAPLRR